VSESIPPQPAANEGGIVVVVYALLAAALAAGLVVGCGAGWALRSVFGG